MCRQRGGAILVYVRFCVHSGEDLGFILKKVVYGRFATQLTYEMF